MANAIEYALMAGRAYQTTRGQINWLPDLTTFGWTEYLHIPNPDIPTTKGFEASFFQKGNEIVISFAGTGSGVDWLANLAGGIGLTSDQLRQAADYYLQVKAVNPPGTIISFTGHSLGGGLASLLAVFFGETAVTFDQAPFRNSASVAVANTLLSYLSDPARGYSVQDLQGLTNFISVSANGGIPNESSVLNFSVQGEILSAASGLRIGIPTSLTHGAPDLMLAFDLHSQALLTAFLQSNQTAPSQQSFSDVTFKLPDVVRMIFDSKLFEHPTARSNTTDENFIERLVRHQNGVSGLTVGETPITADAMVTRFTADLWQIAQDGGLTLNEAFLSRALTAFAMQKYYDETQASAGYNKTLFTGVAGGIQFDIKDVASTPAAAKGYADFRTFLEQYYTTAATDLTGATVISVSPDKNQILSALSSLRDWYIQAGADAMNATDTLNRNAFMFGDTGDDTLTGGTGNDLLVGNTGADTLTGGAGGDWMIGGAGADTLDGGAGYDTYTLEGNDTIRDSDGQGILKDKAGNVISGVIEKRADGTYAYLSNTSVSVTLDANLTLTLTLSDGTVAVIENFTSGNLGLQLADTAIQTTTLDIVGDIVPTDIYPGAAGIQAVPDANGNPRGAAGSYEDILTGSMGNDHILSGELDDNVGGGAGDDWIEAGTGSDYVNGEAGNDLIEGNAGADILAGDAGNDQIFGDVKIDTAAAIANGNADAATGLKGDWLSGGSGDDILVAGASNDVLAGGGGNDLIIAGAGDDNIFGDADYTAQFIPETTPRYYNGPISAYHTSAEPFNWTVTPASTSSDPTVFSPATGTNNPADSGNDIIYAGDGADHVWAGAGSDVVYGESGNDTINGEAGNDILMGGTGDDELYGDGNMANTGDDYLDGGDGNDTLAGGNGSDVILGGAGDDKLYGEDGANYLEGGDGNDALNSGGPGSNLLGGAGNDDLTAAGGGNTLDGGEGNDTLAADGGNNYLDGGNGTNSLQATGGNNALFAGTGNDDLAAWGDGNYLDGGEGNNTLYAQDTNNELYAGTGNDTLSATGGGNYLDGGAGNNTLIADTGGNTLIAGTGDDYLSSSGGGYLDGGVETFNWTVTPQGNVWVFEAANDATQTVWRVAA